MKTQWVDDSAAQDKLQCAISRGKTREVEAAEVRLKLPLADWLWVEYGVGALLSHAGGLDPSDVAQINRIVAAVQEIILKTEEAMVGVHEEDR